MPKPPSKSPVRDLMIFAIASFTQALNATTVTPVESFVLAKAFMAEAEKQLPHIVEALTDV